MAEKLVDDLRQVRVPGQEGTVAGQYVEPVQLQVVCYQLWENIKGRPPGPITAENLAEAGDVNQALSRFYEKTLQSVLTDPAALGVSERQLRAWFDGQLITEAGTRGLVRQDEEETGGLPNAVVRGLQSHFLVRSETRSGDTWIELVHDRLIEPVRADNAAWFAANLSTLERQAALWDEQKRPDGLLLRGEELVKAERWASEHKGGLEPHEAQYLAACQEARAAAERTRHQTRRIRTLAIGAAAFGIAAALMAWIAFRQLMITNQARLEAQTAQAKAEDESRRALSAESMATARLLVTQGEAVFDLHPLLGLRLALEGWRVAPEETKESVLRSAQAMAGSGRVVQFGLPGLQQTYVGTHVPFLVADLEGAPGQLRWPTGKVITLTGEVDYGGATFSPDGAYFILRYLDAPAEFRWSRDPEQAIVLSGKPSEVQISADGTYFALEYADAPTELRRPTGEIIVLDRAPGDRPDAVVSPDGGSVAVRYKDDTVELRSSAHLEQSIVLSQATNHPQFSPKGNYLSLYNVDNSWSQLFTRTGQLLLAGYSSVTISPNDRFILVTYPDQTSELRDIRGGRIVSLPAGTESLSWAAHFSQSEDLLFLVGAYGKNKLYTIAESGEIAPAAVSFKPHNVHEIAFTPDSSHLMLEYTISESVAKGWPALVERNRFDTGDVVTFTGRYLVNGFSFSPDGRYVLVYYQGPYNELRRIDTGKTVFASLLNEVKFIPDTAYFMVKYQSQVGELWDGSDLHRLADLGLGARVDYRNEWRYDPATKRLLMAYGDGRISRAGFELA